MGGGGRHLGAPAERGECALDAAVASGALSTQHSAVSRGDVTTASLSCRASLTHNGPDRFIIGVDLPHCDLSPFNYGPPGGWSFPCRIGPFNTIKHVIRAPCLSR